MQLSIVLSIDFYMDCHRKNLTRTVNFPTRLCHRVWSNAHHHIYIYINYIALAIDSFLGPLAIDRFLCPSAGGLKKGSRARAQEGINSKGSIIDIQYLICIRMHSYASVTHPYTPICFHTLHLSIQTPIPDTHFPKNKNCQQHMSE